MAISAYCCRLIKTPYGELLSRLAGFERASGFKDYTRVNQIGEERHLFNLCPTEDTSLRQAQAPVAELVEALRSPWDISL
jgi:hypothetical protein